MTVSLQFTLPKWLTHESQLIRDLEGQMQYAIRLSESNVRNGTGGPFGAAVFSPLGQLLGHGVNRVVPQRCCCLHAEVMAIMHACSRLNSYDLGLVPGSRLVSSCEPCLMCQGAVMWSGVSELAYAATGSDAERIGFDEGFKREDWREQLELRGMIVHGPILRDDALAVLLWYAKHGGSIYNPER